MLRSLHLEVPKYFQAEKQVPGLIISKEICASSGLRRIGPQAQHLKAALQRSADTRTKQQWTTLENTLKLRLLSFAGSTYMFRSISKPKKKCAWMIITKGFCASSGRGRPCPKAQHLKAARQRSAGTRTQHQWTTLENTLKLRLLSFSGCT
ncbi:hypothetical protein V5799_027107 [Amblyomma americanum]|uniref:Uncharacterized protein n=1 Tax=Amblyomma americanum TaxID=6943 RepID=A0AAQ4DGN6_AMBAM